MNDYYACNLHNKQIDHKITYNLYLQSFFINKITTNTSLIVYLLLNDY